MFGAFGSSTASLRARPSLVRIPSVARTGRAQRLRLDVEAGSRDGILHVPSSYDPDQPSPLLVFLHGASAGGKDCESVFTRVLHVKDCRAELEAGRVIVMLPDSRGRTWDVIRGGFGPDVQYIDRALSKVFQEYRIDPSRVCCGGFSDGASYALSLGLPNASAGASSLDPGERDDGLFTHIMALSPGFIVSSVEKTRTPKIFISHGVCDEVLSIDHCSRRIVPRLALQGLPPQLLTYQEFPDGHSIPQKIASQALNWFVCG